MSERQEKRVQFQQQKKKIGLLPLVIAVLVVVAAAGIVGWNAVGSNGKYQSVTAHSGSIDIPAAQVNDGKAHFFRYNNGGTSVDFFLLKSHDGVIRAAFDACDVCYKARKGYRQEGAVMVCNNCNQQFRSDLINEVKGGCNPAPLKRTFAEGRIVIAATDLAEGARYFQGK